ncbi:MAG: biopolymer transporter ExbD [Verrucomicrobiota bacterium]
MKLQSTLRDHAGFLYIAPVMDVVLLLLVFFLLSTSFVLQSGVRVSVPKSASSLPRMDQFHVITVMAGSSPRLFFNDEEISFPELGEKLEEADAAIREVIVRADELAAFGVVMRVSEEARRQNYSVAFATAGS